MLANNPAKKKIKAKKDIVTKTDNKNAPIICTFRMNRRLIGDIARNVWISRESVAANVS